ncbi:MAG: STAS domain-containing protein, partial [Mycobacteriaceae bacterium]|nr:STAS domain-containing protein [Mycobacteriaceae bacterium]
GLPGAGTMGATLVNVDSGGHTRRSGVLEGAFVLAAALVFGRWIAWVPVAALAGILLVVAGRMVDWSSFQLLRQRETRLDFFVVATVIVVAVTTNLIAAAGAGVALAIVLFLREQIRGTVIRRAIAGNRISSTQHRLPEEVAVLERCGEQTLVCELQGSLFFGTTDQLLTELEPRLRSCRFLVLDLRRIHTVDFTAAQLLERFEKTLAERNGWLLLSRVPAHLPSGRNLHDYFARLGVIGARRRVRVCPSLDDALLWVEDQILDENICRVSDDTPLALAEFDLVREFEADQTLAALASCIAERSYAAGELVFRAGDPGTDLYLIRRGIVRISLPLRDGGHHNLSSSGRGHFFGEMAFLTRSPRTADAVAVTDTELYVIPRQKFDDVSRAHPIVGVKIFSRVARTLALHLRR